MVNPMIQSMRSAFHFHYHTFWRHTTSTAVDPTNVVTVKKPICSRLFSIQTPPPTNGKEAPVNLPFHVRSGLNNRIAVRSHHHSIPPFALLPAEQSGPDAEEEPFGADSFYCQTRSLQYNALITVQSNESTESNTDSSNESEHEEKDNDHIVVQTKAIRRKSLVEKLQPIDSLFATHGKKSFNFDEHIQSEQPIDRDDNLQLTFDESFQSEKSVTFDDHFRADSLTKDTFHFIEPSQNGYVPVSQAKILAAFANHKPVEPVVTVPLATAHVDENDGDAVPTHYFDNSLYVGRLVDGMPEGPAQMVYADGSAYAGMFRAGQRCGSGIFIWPQRGEYDGEFMNDLRHGYGEWKSYHELSEYRGQWSCDRRHGQGDQFVNGVCVYTGSWRCDQRHGLGTGIWDNGAKFSGEWMNGMPTETGVTTDKFGNVIPGQWQAGKFVPSKAESPSTSFVRTPESEIELLISRAMDFKSKHSHQSTATAC